MGVWGLGFRVVGVWGLIELMGLPVEAFRGCRAEELLDARLEGSALCHWFSKEVSDH